MAKALVTFLGLSSITCIAAHPQPEKLLRTRNVSTLVQPTYQALPLGSISPSGWLQQQLQLQAQGLGGNLFNFYRFVKDSMWLGGSTEYSTLHESSGYWFNGLVPLAFGLDDATLKNQIKSWLDYVLDHQQADGWLGPETTHATRGLWGRCYVLLGLMQYAQADPSETDRIVDAMHRYVELAHSMLMDNFTGLIEQPGDVFDGGPWGAARAHEMHISLGWLYENHPRNNSQLIWDTLDLMIQGNTAAGLDWRGFFVDGVFPEVTYDPTSISEMFTHGVNLAEAVRFPLAIYRMSHDEALKTQTRTAIDLVGQYHTSLAGTIIGDEHITDLNPNRGAELCTTVELLFSLSWIYQYLADNDIADWAEQIAFNALPAQVYPDWWSHQYVQQENQPWSRNLTVAPQMWQDVGSYGNVFGEEPNWLGNPKFLANSFVLTQDGGIAHVLLSPGSVTTTLNNNKVTISAETNYPFSMDLSYSINADEAFTFYVRIPTWASSSSTTTGPSSSASAAVSPSDQGLQKFSVPKGQSQISVNLQTAPRVVERANNTAAVYYGPLLYSLALDFNASTRAPEVYSTNGLVPANSTTGQTVDHILETTDPWNVAIDPSQIKVVERASPDSTLSNPVWQYGAPPVELHVAAVEIDWPIEFDTPANPPQNIQTTGKPFSARFVPFGSAHVHMAHFPKVNLAEVNLGS
ncbi:duf1680 domain-containing protein [Xylariaceae sp. FL0255]|nr:duf1680 domain-containing protein [Xylariaceae sp. FL0255]